MSTKKPMSREEIEAGWAEHQRKLKEDLGPWYDAINWNALLPDPWTVLLQREKDGQTLQ